MCEDNQYNRNMYHLLIRLIKFVMVDNKMYVNFNVNSNLHFNQYQSFVTELASHTLQIISEY
jgi:hypothetical protein